MAVFTGTSGADTYAGTSNADSISGLGGNDTLNGAAGIDTIDGGDGNDRIDGGTGDDSITGGTGLDNILGGAGNDTIDAGIENDTVDGGTNNDVIRAGDGSNSVYGNSGNDTITSGSGNDLIYGDKDPADTVPGGQFEYQAYLYGTNFTDPGAFPGHHYGGISITGAPIRVVFQDDDTLLRTDGTAANNDLFNEPNQVVIINGVTYPVLLEQIVTYTDGTNTYRFMQCDYDYNRNGYGDQAHIQEQGGLQILISSPPPPVGVNLTVVANSIDTTSDLEYDANWDDLISSGAGSDQIYGQQGNDTIDSGADGDTVDGGIGNDSIRAGAGTDSVQGGEGADLIYGEAGADNINGGLGDDTLDGGSENDTIMGGLGNDSILGGSGSDSIIGDADNDTIHGNDDNDSIQSGVGADSVFGDAGNDTIDADIGNDSVYGGSGADSLSGSGGNDLIYGDDTVAGALDGDDTISGGIGADTVHAGGGNDSVDGGADNDSLLGDAGNDTMQGGSGNDTLDGGAGIDLLFGGTGSDQFTVGRGDSATGGSDQDVFTLATLPGGSGSFTIDGNTEAGTTSDFDRIVLGSGLQFVLGSRVSTIDADGDSTSGSFRVTDGTNTYTVNFTEIEELPVCFVRGSLIETMDGPVAIEKLRAGDMIRTRDNGYKAISWIGSRVFLNDRSETLQRISPIRIRAGALGQGLPARDLYLSPQHRVLVRSRIAERMFGQDEVLVAVKHLLALEGVDAVEDFGEVEYFHILFDQHEIVYADGLEAESLFTGAQALKALDADARAEILTIFPELAEMTPEAQPKPARLMPVGRMARQLAARHLKNGLPLQ